MPSTTNVLPYGVQLLEKLFDKFPILNRFGDRNSWYKYSVLVLTFITYVAYHASRKPISVVKIVLYQNCSDVTPAPANNTDPDWCNWAPFNAENHNALFGTLDSAFLFAYAIAMFFSGLIAERVNIRIFLTIGMILSGTACSMFGLAQYYDIHSMWYFIGVQIFGGISQTTGWPGVVTAMGNWFGKGNRGFIFGIWNSHTSIGNIIGTLLASLYVETDWGLSFIVPGLFIIISGLLNFFFLVIHPYHILKKSNLTEKPAQNSDGQTFKRNGIRRQSPRYDGNIPEENETLKDSSEEKKLSASPQEVSIPLEDISSKELSLLPSNKDEVKEKTEGSPILVPNGSSKKAVGFVGAIKIPGVIEFSMCLFFAKLVSYTFLYWLPNYIKTSSTYSPSQSADLSTLFDVGGIFGGIAAGIFSDMFGKSASTCAVMLFLAIPSLYAYNLFSSINLYLNIALLIIVGGLVNGPYALITTAVSAELGTHNSLKGNAKALSTVTSIIDGTGSIGAAVGPLLAANISNTFGWTSVFYMLMCSNILAILLLGRLVKRELQNVG